MILNMCVSRSVCDTEYVGIRVCVFDTKYSIWVHLKHGWLTRLLLL